MRLLKYLKLYESTDKNLYYKKIDRESSEKMIAIGLSKETIVFLNKRLKDSNTKDSNTNTYLVEV